MPRMMALMPQQILSTLLLQLLLLLLPPTLCAGGAMRSQTTSSFWIPATTHSLSGVLDYVEQLASEESSSFVRLEEYPVVQPTERFLRVESNEVFYVTMEFSLWYPAMQGRVVKASSGSSSSSSSQPSSSDENTEFLTSAILGLLRDFLCDDMKSISVVNALNHSQSLCRTGVERYNEGLEEALDFFEPVNSTVQQWDNDNAEVDTQLTIGTVVVTDHMESDVAWMSWEVTYQVVQVGSPYHVGGSSTGSMASTLLSQASPLLQDAVQDTLDTKIQQGSLNKRLRKYLLVGSSSRGELSVVGQEVETFSASAMSLEDEYDYSYGAMILRYIGIGLIAVVTCLFVILTVMARRQRLNRERQEQAEEEARLQRERNEELRNAPHDTTSGTNQVLLETEDDVNRMLSLGRAESIKAMRGSSLFLKSSVNGLKITAEL